MEIFVDFDGLSLAQTFDDHQPQIVDNDSGATIHLSMHENPESLKLNLYFIKLKNYTGDEQVKSILTCNDIFCV